LKDDVRKEDNAGMVGRDAFSEKPLASQGNIQLSIPVLPARNASNA
jgi:hypothetical protein